MNVIDNTVMSTDKVWIEIMMNDNNLESNSTQLLVY